MSRSAGTRRFGATVEAGTVYVGTPQGRVEVDDLDRVLDRVGGPAWQVEYPDRATDAMDTADEGLVVDVVDAIDAMTFDQSFVETLAAQPGRARGSDDSPRLGMFVGRLTSDLQYGLN